MAAGQGRFLGSITRGVLTQAVLAVCSGPLNMGGFLLTLILLTRHPTQQFCIAPPFLEDPSQLSPLRRVPRP